MTALAVLTILIVGSVSTSAKTIFECTPDSKFVQKLPFFLCEVKGARLVRTEGNQSHEKVRVFVQSLKPSKAEEAFKKQTKTKLVRKKRVARRHNGYPGYPHGGGGFGGGFSMAQANSVAVGGGAAPFGGGGGGAIASANANALSFGYGRR